MVRSKKKSKNSKKTGRPIKVDYGSGNVFRDIGFSDQEAQNLQLRSTLMIAIKQEILQQGWSQSKAADELGVVQPRISDLLNGRISRFSIDLLVSYLNRLGKTITLKITESKAA